MRNVPPVLSPASQALTYLGILLLLLWFLVRRQGG